MTQATLKIKLPDLLIQGLRVYISNRNGTKCRVTVGPKNIAKHVFELAFGNLNIQSNMGHILQDLVVGIPNCELGFDDSLGHILRSKPKALGVLHILAGAVSQQVVLLWGMCTHVYVRDIM